MSQQNTPAHSGLHRIPPELWGEIAENFLWEHHMTGFTPVQKSGSILPFLQTCREFHELAIPILYRYIRWVAGSGKVQKALEQVLVKNSRLHKLVRAMSILGNKDDWNTFYRGGGILDNVPPLDRLTGLQRIHLQDINLTSELRFVVLSLPGLRELTLLRCNLSIDTGYEAATPVPSSTSLEVLKLHWIQQELSLGSFLKLFPKMHKFQSTAFRTQTRHVLDTLKRVGVVSLTSLKVIIRSKEVAVVLAELLNVAPNVEVIDISHSEAEVISIATDSIPRLHTYRGPPHLASSFIKGRGVHTVAFIPFLAELGVPKRHMVALQMSSTPIKNVFIYPSPRPSEYAEFTQAVKIYAGNDCACAVIHSAAQGVELLESIMIPTPPY